MLVLLLTVETLATLLALVAVLTVASVAALLAWVPTPTRQESLTTVSLTKEYLLAAAENRKTTSSQNSRVHYPTATV